jgi:hypothetical protein
LELESGRTISRHLAGSARTGHDRILEDVIGLT